MYGKYSAAMPKVPDSYPDNEKTRRRLKRLQGWWYPYNKSQLRRHKSGNFLNKPMFKLAQKLEFGPVVRHIAWRLENGMDEEGNYIL